VNRAPSIIGRVWSSVSPAAIAALALLATIAATAGLLALGGYPPGQVFAALVRGAFGSWDRFVSVTLVRSTPLLLTGLAVAVAFKARVWKIGAEGQLHAGALAGVAVAVFLPFESALLLVPATFVAAGMAGATWASIPAVMKTKLGVSEVITTLLMNFVALYLAQFLVQGPLREARGVFNQTDEIPAGARLPMLLPDTRLHVGFLIGIIIAIALWLYLTRTAGGFRLRAVGASVRAAAVSGRFGATPVIWFAFLLSGTIAGLAGWVQIAGVTHRMYEGISPGWGYTAIAVALLARLSALAVGVTEIIVGALRGGGGAMQREAGVPDAWVRGIEALVVLAVLAVDRGAQALNSRGSRG